MRSRLSLFRFADDGFEFRISLIFASRYGVLTSLPPSRAFAYIYATAATDTFRQLQSALLPAPRWCLDFASSHSYWPVSRMVGPMQRNFAILVSAAAYFIATNTAWPPNSLFTGLLLLLPAPHDMSLIYSASLWSFRS